MPVSVGMRAFARPQKTSEQSAKNERYRRSSHDLWPKIADFLYSTKPTLSKHPRARGRDQQKPLHAMDSRSLYKWESPHRATTHIFRTQKSSCSPPAVDHSWKEMPEPMSGSGGVATSAIVASVCLHLL